MVRSDARLGVGSRRNRWQQAAPHPTRTPGTLAREAVTVAVSFMCGPPFVLPRHRNDSSANVRSYTTLPCGPIVLSWRRNKHVTRLTTQANGPLWPWRPHMTPTCGRVTVGGSNLGGHMGAATISEVFPSPITVLVGHAGTGKTNTSLGLALALAKEGY